jgi:CubicO group peptidase (beta-lactamase class C family)
MTYSPPEAQGIPSSALLALLSAAERSLDSLHSLILLRGGHTVAAGWWAPYAPDRPHELFSLSKSFTSTAVGLAVAEGRLTVDDPVLSFFPDEAPAAPGEHLAAMRVRHLLTMTAGHAEDPPVRGQGDDNWVRVFFHHPLPYAPGTRFVYSSTASYVLSAIVQRLTGQPIVEYLQPRLFDPLGIAPPSWITCPRGINAGGWGLSLKSGDIARFGQTLLQRGA